MTVWRSILSNENLHHLSKYPTRSYTWEYFENLFQQGGYFEAGAKIKEIVPLLREHVIHGEEGLTR